MNNQNGSTQRFLTLLLLFFAGNYLAKQFGLFGANDQNKTGQQARPAMTLKQTFAGMAPGSPALNAAQAQAEIKKLEAAIAQNKSDEYSYSAHLRAGLLQQYLANNPKAALEHYTQVVNHAGTDAITAQATYQKGDLLWNQAVKAGDVADGEVKNKAAVDEAAKTLEQLIHKGRGSSAFLDLQIYVPRTLTTAGSIPDFQLRRVGDLRGTLAKPDLEGIPDRVNAWYQPTLFYKVFDGAVKIFGANPSYSYGLAILFFAIITRTLMHPLNKKQYESMKGLQVIAPEMKKILEKYKGKPEQQMQMVKETRELQAAHGVSPMLGCGLALIQIPVFIWVVAPLIQHYEAKMELAGASFLWIQNLARPDIALLIAYALSQFLSFRLSATPPTDPQQAQMQATMGFLMPLTVPFFLHSYPSAFTLYWMTFNIISTFFQYRMMKAADPQKSLIKTLVGKTPALAAATDSAATIPPRPQSAKAKTKSAASNGTRQVSSTHVPPDRPEERKNIVSRNGLNGTSTEVEDDSEIDAPQGDENGAADPSAARGANGSSANGSSSRRARQRRRH